MCPYAVESRLVDADTGNYLDVKHFNHGARREVLVRPGTDLGHDKY